MIVLSIISFKNPWFLLLALIPVWWYVRLYLRKEKGEVPMWGNSGWYDHHQGSIRAKLTWIPRFMGFLGLLSLVFALGRPRLPIQEQEIKADGIDIMLALDLSSSMLARDFDPDRLEASKEVAMDFVDKRKYDRIGLVVFAGEAFTQCPLTTDHMVLKDFIQGVNIGLLEDGTAIGMGLATAVNRIKDSDAKSKIIILLTDGVNNKGYIEPMTAAEIAKEYGIKVYTIGVGTTGFAPMPVNRRMDGSYIFRNARVEIDEQLLHRIADITGGKYFRAVDKENLEKIYDEIDRLEKTEIEVLVLKKYRELFRFSLLLGLGLIFLSALFRKTIFNVLS